MQTRGSQRLRPPRKPPCAVSVRIAEWRSEPHRLRSNKLDTIRTAPIHLLIPGGLLAILVLAFLAFFLIPGLIHWFRLRAVERGISKLEGRTPPGEFRKLFARDAKLAHLWKQYQDSLHIQREEKDGQMVPVAVRATLPADTFLNTQSMVDGRLSTEFFKHLPGIFTGIGIIGTFAGLIEGLRQFQVSENAATVRASLESLMHSVGEAFLVSASAIAAAMIVTFIEKLLLASLYAQAEEIAHAIDARFDAGAGEDYLSRLVKASEDSATQSKTLKDALVAELGQLMRELAGAHAEANRSQQDRFIERIEAATRQQADALGAAIAVGIEKGLKAPLDEIARAIKPAEVPEGEPAQDIGAAVAASLAAFGERITTLLERQVSSAGDVNRQSARDMQEAVQALQSLVNGMAEQMRTSQSDSGYQLQAAVDETTRQISGMLKALGDTQQQVLGDTRARDQSMLESTTTAMSTMSGDMTDAAREAATQMNAAAQQMAKSVQVLSQTTSSAIDRMSAGAESMNGASKGFATAAERAGEAMTSARTVANGLGEISVALTTGASSLQEGLGDYRSQREALAMVLTELKDTVAVARREAAMSGDVLGRIELSTQRLSEAQRQTEQYLAGVSHVLGDAHQAFAVSMRKTLELANTEFHDKLSTSVGLLASTIAELEAALGNAVSAAGPAARGGTESIPGADNGKRP
ncbi:anti-phage ZorAB system protein ZorA [soil metagenome]